MFALVWSKTNEGPRERVWYISDVGVGKICKRMGIPKPPPGYWARIASGYKVRTPRLPPIKKGQRNGVEIWPTIKRASVEKRDPTVGGLIEREKLTDNLMVVAEDLQGAHKLVSYANKI